MLWSPTSYPAHCRLYGSQHNRARTPPGGAAACRSSNRALACIGCVCAVGQQSRSWLQTAVDQAHLLHGLVLGCWLRLVVLGSLSSASAASTTVVHSVCYSVALHCCDCEALHMSWCTLVLQLSAAAAASCCVLLSLFQACTVPCTPAAWQLVWFCLLASA